MKPPVTLLLLLAFLSASPLVAGDLDPLLNRVPASMNAIAVVHVDAINRTPRGKAEKFRETHEADYMFGSVSVPPWAKVIVLSARLQPGHLADAQIGRAHV